MYSSFQVLVTHLLPCVSDFSKTFQVTPLDKLPRVMGPIQSTSSSPTPQHLAKYSAPSLQPYLGESEDQQVGGRMATLPALWCWVLTNPVLWAVGLHQPAFAASHMHTSCSRFASSLASHWLHVAVPFCAVTVCVHTNGPADDNAELFSVIDSNIGNRACGKIVHIMHGPAFPVALLLDSSIGRHVRIMRISHA